MYISDAERLEIAGIRDRKSWIAWCKHSHPDYGGNSNTFATIKNAYDKLSDEEGNVICGQIPRTRPHNIAQTMVEPNSSSSKYIYRGFEELKRAWYARYGKNAHVRSETESKNRTSAKTRSKQNYADASARQRCEATLIYKYGLNNCLEVEQRCRNIARHGFVYCESHKKFNVDAERKEAKKQRFKRN